MIVVTSYTPQFKPSMNSVCDIFPLVFSSEFMAVKQLPHPKKNLQVTNKMPTSQKISFPLRFSSMSRHLDHSLLLKLRSPNHQNNQTGLI